MPQNTKQKAIFLFCGEDTYSSSQKLKFWKEQFIKKYGEESNVEVFEGENIDINNFDTNIETVPFLCEKRLIIVKNFLTKAPKEIQQKIVKTLDKVPDFSVLVFYENNEIEKTNPIYKKMKEVGEIEEFKNLAPAELAKWILNKAKTKKIKITNTTANYLALHCGTELWRISNELEKLALYANNGEITEKMIDELVTPSLSASIFKLTDAIAEKNPDKSLKTLQVLLDSGEDLSRIFFMIVRHFRILIQVHDLASKKEPQFSITKKLKQHPFVIQKTLSQSKNFNAEKLEEIYKKLLQTDIKNKTGKIKTFAGDDSEYKLEIEKLIIECCR